MEKIKANVGYSYNRNCYYYKEFEVVTSLPEVGDEVSNCYEETKIVSINPIRLEGYNNDSCFRYDYFEVVSKETESGEEYFEYLAIEKEAI